MLKLGAAENSNYNKLYSLTFTQYNQINNSSAKYYKI